MNKLDPSDLLIQSNPDALDELVDASTLSVFNSGQAIRFGYFAPGRVSIPISDEEAHVTYRIACMNNEKTKYSFLFNSVRSELLQNQ